MVGKGGERRFRAEIRLGDSGARLRVGPTFFVLLCLLSIPKRNFVWETPLGIKRVWLAKVRNDDFGPKSASEILVCACAGPAFFVLLCLLSIPKRNFVWETPLGVKRVCWAKVENDDVGPRCTCKILVRVRVCPFFFRAALCSQFPNETSCGRHH